MEQIMKKLAEDSKNMPRVLVILSEEQLEAVVGGTDCNNSIPGDTRSCMHGVPLSQSCCACNNW